MSSLIRQNGMVLPPPMKNMCTKYKHLTANCNFYILSTGFKDKELVIGDPDLNLGFCLENKYVSSPCPKCAPKIIILPLTLE